VDTILRTKYLDLLEKYKDKKFIKVLTGMRRVGKSTIMSQYIDLLKNKYSIDDNRIIIYDFNEKKNLDLN
jgi:predicted AAA+ superfamily ATPase